MKYVILINLLIIATVTTGALFVVRSLTAPLPPEQNNEVFATAYDYRGEGYSISMEYPLVPGSTPGTLQANKFLRQEINKKAESFKDSLKELAVIADGEATAEGTESYLEGYFNIEEKNDRYASIFYGIEGYSRGAAHPFHTMLTYVFDYKNDKLVQVSDMFKQNSDYLHVLSTLSKEDLMRQSKTGVSESRFDESTVESGTKPEEDNFRNILPLRDGLAIYFEEYQVAPYAAGPQRVVIPYEKLKDVIHPDGILGAHIK